MRITTYGSTVNLYEKGAIILFENDEKLEWPTTEVDCGDWDNRGYEYSVFVRLNKSDVLKLSTHQITDIRLYIYDEELKADDAMKYLEYMKCIAKQ